MAYCYNCGSPLGDSDKFCASCGAAVIAAQSGAEPVAEVPAEQPAAQQPAEETATEPVTEPAASVGEPAAAPEEARPASPVEPAQLASDAASVTPQGGAAEQPAQPTQHIGGTAGGASFPGGGFAPQQPGAPQQPPQDFTYRQHAAPGSTQGSIPTGQTMQTPAIVPPQGPSPLARAWSDFKASPSKLKIILKLAAFQFVPGVGGLVTSGYVYTWAKEQAFGKHEPMPQKIVRPGVLDSGLYAYGVSLILSVAMFALFFVLGLLLGAINLDGLMPLIWLALAIFTGPFFTVMYLRSAICGKVRSGLNVKRAWEMFTAQNKTGKAFTSYWGPMAAALGLTIVAFIIFFILLGVVVGTSLAPLAFSGYGMSYGYASAYAASTAFAAIMSFFPLIIILLFAIFFVGTAASMVIARAFGYWMQDFNPREWPEYQENAWYYQNSVL